ncbi:MAG: helix-turn-helix domain-containing protein [Gammaproteobacteria bacterium]|nr:helix-turn-helix domain-containing protein [Gammaproteobacteria bacterium]
MRTDDDVRSTRVTLGLTQTELATILGLHYVTVCRWERGHMTPKPWVLAIFHRFRVAATKADIGGRMARVLALRGPLAALYLGLAVSYGRNPKTAERDLINPD